MRNPYVTGAYVTGSKHYGREELIDFVLHGESRAHWVVGNRRIGKTSLLRHLELLAQREAHLVPVYWDMQGCTSLTCLGRYLADGVNDQPERFDAIGMPPSLPEEEDALALLSQLRRLALRAGRELLVLCDETEVLIELARSEPEAMQRFHRLLTGGPGLRVVMASTRQIYRLHDVCREWPTSSFLAGFDMSHTLGSLDPAAGRKLILQSQEPRAGRVQAGPKVVKTLSFAANNHPLLLQLLCSRLFQDNGSLSPLNDNALRVDSVLAGFFEYDFRQLTEIDRRIVLAVHQRGATQPAALREVVQEGPVELRQRLDNLEALGYLRTVNNRICIGSLFAENWLLTETGRLGSLPSLQTSESAMRAVFARQQVQDVDSLVSQLNLRRGRLIELEAVRARELPSVPSQVLAEIEQLEVEIAELRRLLDRRRAA